MRIITGKYKGRHFDIPRSFKARPTTDFAKENIFNVLQQYIDFDSSTALDLFSGTGSITLELLSRGCSQVVSVELDRDHHRFIQQCVAKLQGENTVLGQSRVWRCNQQSTFSDRAECGVAILDGAKCGVAINVKCVRGDVFRFIKSCHQQFDFIFADPPDALKELPQIPDMVFEKGLLKPEGVFVFEHGKDHDFAQHPHFVEHRSYGSVNFSLFR